MKTHFNKLILCAAVMLGANVVFAGPGMPKPGCPDVMSIAAAGVSVARSTNNEVWAAIAPANTYKTDHVWAYVVERIEAKSAQEVLAKINRELSNMVLTDSILYDSDGSESYLCLYEHETDPAIIGVAVTPNTDIDSAAFTRFKQHTMKMSAVNLRDKI